VTRALRAPLELRYHGRRSRSVCRDRRHGRLARGDEPRVVATHEVLREHLDTIIQRDLSMIAQVHDRANVRRLLSAIASRSAALLNFDSLARDLTLSANTVRSPAALLETLFLTARAEAWSGNLLNRVVKTPKACVADSGLRCLPIGADEHCLPDDSAIAGAAFEHVRCDGDPPTARLAGQRPAAVSLPRPRRSRGRHRARAPRRLGRSVVAVEVKTAASASSPDFRGLRHPRDKLGDRFRAGVLLYTGEHTVPFEDRLAAVPMCGLWTDPA
jgi:hypothetical protein